MRKYFAIGAVLFLYGALAFADTSDKEALTAAKAMVQRFADSWNHAGGVAYGENYWPEAGTRKSVWGDCDWKSSHR